MTAVVAAIGLLPLGGVVANAQGGLGSVDDLVKFIVRNAENAPRRTASVDDIRNTTRAVLQPAAEEGTGFNIILKPACTALDIYGFDSKGIRLDRSSCHYAI